MINLPYVEQGDASGVPVVMLHGATDSWRSFEPVLPHLPDDIRAVAVTQRGHGDAPKPESGYSIDDLAGDVVSLMDQLEIGPALLVGHSMGSMVTQRIAIDHPERLIGVVLAGCFPHPAVSDEVVVELLEVFTSLEDPIPREIPHEFQASNLAGPLPSGQLDGFVDESMKVPAHVWRGIFESIPDVDFSDELAGITAPTKLIYGDQDAFITRADQEQLLDAIPDSRLTVYEGIGHAMHWEQPERFAADVVEFSRYCAGLQLSR